MHIFYTPEISPGFCFLNKNESNHCVKVLRLKLNDIIQLVDGKGNSYEAKIINPNSKKCEFEVINKIENFGKRNFELSIAIAPTKNINRFEWFLEKSTEIGIEHILPFKSFHSERKIIKQERSEKVIIAAMKQSVKAYKPDLKEMQSLKNLIKNNFEGQKFIAYCKTDNQIEQKRVADENVLILIGPEGGFSEQEIDLAKKYGFIPISFGKSRLRSETAGVVACTYFSFQ